jgi:membrane protease YdiL (CAAX protease family)
LSPTLTRELDPYFLLPVLLLDACPVAMSNRLLRSWPWARRPGLYHLYGAILLLLCLINFRLLGPPSLAWSWGAVAWGLGLGVAATAVDAFFNLYLARRLARRRGRLAARPGGRGRVPELPRAPRRLRSWERPGKDPWAVDQRFPLLVGLGSAGLEEALYRHYFLLLLAAAGGGLALAVLASSLVYGLIHEPFGTANVLSKTVLGVLFAAAYLLSANLLLPLLAHAALNGAVYLSRRSLRRREGAVA